MGSVMRRRPALCAPDLPCTGRSLTDGKKKCSRTSFPKKACGHSMRLAVGGWWRLVISGGWWEWAVGGWWSLGAVLNKKKQSGPLRTTLPLGIAGGRAGNVPGFWMLQYPA